MHVSVGACSAGRGGEGLAGPGRAGFLKMLQIPCQIVFQIPFQILVRIDLLFENEAFVDFQRGNEQKRRRSAAFSRVYYWKNDQPLNFIETGTAAVWAEIRFYLHKKFRRGPGSDFDLQEEARPGWNFIYTKKFPAAGSRFSLCKEFV